MNNIAEYKKNIILDSTNPRNGNNEINIGLLVKKYRLKRGITRQVLANKSGISLRYLAQLESGKGNPTVSIIANIAYALNLSSYEFFYNDILPRFPGDTVCVKTKVKYSNEMLRIAINDLGEELNNEINEMLLVDPDPVLSKFFKKTYVAPKRWGVMIREKQIQELLEKGLIGHG